MSDYEVSEQDSRLWRRQYRLLMVFLWLALPIRMLVLLPLNFLGRGLEAGTDWLDRRVLQWPANRVRDRQDALLDHVRSKRRAFREAKERLDAR